MRDLGYDKHLFLLKLDNVSLSQTTPFYQSVLRAGSTDFKAERDCSQMYGHIGEELVLNNPHIQCSMLSAASVKSILIRAGMTKVGHLRSGGRWETAAQLGEEMSVQSVRLLERLLKELVGALPSGFREAIGKEPTLGEATFLKGFLSLCISAAGGGAQSSSILQYS